MHSAVRTTLYILCGVGLFAMLLITFAPAISAPQQAAGAAVVLTWTGLVHFISSALDRQAILKRQSGEER